VEKTDFRVVVLGGYGNFGTLIVRRLRSIAGIRVWLAGRDLAKAETLALETGSQAVHLDMSQADLAELEGLAISSERRVL